MGFYSPPLPANEQRSQSGLLENAGWGGEWWVGSEGPAITNKAPSVQQTRHKSSPRAGMGRLRTPWPGICSGPGSRHLRLPRTPDLLLKRLQVRSPGLLRDAQEVPVAVSGHDSIPRGAAEFGDPGSREVASPARDGGLLERFLHVFAFCKKIPCFLRALRDHRVGSAPEGSWHPNRYPGEPLGL